MTTELVLLLSVFALIFLSTINGSDGPKAVFLEVAPKLAARIERNISTGRKFQDGRGNYWPDWFEPQ